MPRKPASGKRKPKKFAINISVDLSEWDMCDWSYALEDCITAAVENGQVIIRLGSDAGDVARKVGEEILQTFFSEGFYSILTPEGLRLLSENHEAPELTEDAEKGITIPWGAMMISMSSQPMPVILALVEFLRCELCDFLYEKDCPPELVHLFNILGEFIQKRADGDKSPL